MEQRGEMIMLSKFNVRPCEIVFYRLVSGRSREQNSVVLDVRVWLGDRSLGDGVALRYALLYP